MPLTWDEPFTLTSPYGSYPINQQVGLAANGAFLIKDGCDSGFPNFRSTSDDVPQSDGSVLHERFVPGYQITLQVGFADMDTPNRWACGAVLQDYLDDLYLHLGAMLKSGYPGRLLWTPESKPIRMIDYARTLSFTGLKFQGGIPYVSFTLDTEFPYAIDFTQSQTALGANVTNGGNTPFFPVFKVYGAFSSFTLSNSTTGLSIVYDSGLPGASAVGGGSYAEIDCFRNTVYLNGNGANLKPGIDVTASDFFALVPGVNVLTISGATADALYNDAWI